MPSNRFLTQYSKFLSVYYHTYTIYKLQLVYSKLYIAHISITSQSWSRGAGNNTRRWTRSPENWL